MDNKLETQECYLSVDVNERLPEPEVKTIFMRPEPERLETFGGLRPFEKSFTHWLEKRTDLYLLTKTEIETLVGNAHSIGKVSGYEIATCGKSSEKTKEEYIKELLK